jgi:adenylate cyclase class 1
VIEFDVNASDVFSFGANKECLVGSVDLVYRNSWNEIRTLHFNGEESVVDALSTILGKMHNDAASPDRIDVFCYAQHFRGLIRNRFQQLVAEGITTRLSSERDQAVKTLVVGNQKFGVFYERRGVSVKKLENAIDFYSQIADTKLERMPLRLDKTHHTKTPEIVASHSSEGLVQFFFENHDTGFNIYIVDEINRVETYQHFSGNKEELVQGVNRFYTSAHSRQDDKSMINFNLPQFYEIVSDANGDLELLPYRSPSITSEPIKQFSSAS